MSEEPRPGRYRQADQTPPEPQRISDEVVMRFEHVYEIDPALMGEHVHQQSMPAWDTLRIVAARWDHLADVHDEFADSVTLAAEGPEVEPDGQ
jgi:hypothetical protein